MQRPTSPDPHAPYTLYKMDVSYFSGKLEAYLRYKEIPHEARDADLRTMHREIYPNTGTLKVPAIRTADGQWLFDTTPTILWLEARYPRGPILPPDPALAFVACLLEDYADEWLWRSAMWWRWEPLASRRALGSRIGELVGRGRLGTWAAGAWFARRQRNEWLWRDGVTRENADRVRDLYLEELDVLEPLLARQPYLLGSHPSLADFGWFGPMFRHFGNDPDPAELMRRRAPAVYEWLARLWNRGVSRLGETPQWRWPEGGPWPPLLHRIAADYLPYLHQNALAFRDGRARFDFRGASLAFDGTATTNYRVWCRQVLQRRHAALAPAERARVDALFAPAGGLGALEADGVVDSGLDAHFALPRPGRTPPERRLPLRMALWGQPRN